MASPSSEEDQARCEAKTAPDAGENAGGDAEIEVSVEVPYPTYFETSIACRDKDWKTIIGHAELGLIVGSSRDLVAGTSWAGVCDLPHDFYEKCGIDAAYARQPDQLAAWALFAVSDMFTLCRTKFGLSAEDLRIRQNCALRGAANGLYNPENHAQIFRELVRCGLGHADACALNREAIRRAARRGRRQVLEALVECFQITPEDFRAIKVLQIFARGGHWDLFEFARQHGQTACDVRACTAIRDTALRNGPLEKFQELFGMAPDEICAAATRHTEEVSALKRQNLHTTIAQYRAAVDTQESVQKEE